MLFLSNVVFFQISIIIIGHSVVQRYHHVRYVLDSSLPSPHRHVRFTAGIFGYLNYLVKRDRRFIADILINGLHRLEYRGYDSSGIAFDGDLSEGQGDQSSSKSKRACLVVRQKGKVEELEHVVKGVHCVCFVFTRVTVAFSSSYGQHSVGR